MDAAKLKSCLGSIQEWTALLSMFNTCSEKARADAEDWAWSGPLMAKWQGWNSANYDAQLLQELQAAQAQNHIGVVRKRLGAAFMPKVIALEEALAEKLSNVRPLASKVQNMARAASTSTPDSSAKTSARSSKKSRKS